MSHYLSYGRPNFAYNMHSYLNESSMLPNLAIQIVFRHGFLIFASES